LGQNAVAFVSAIISGAARTYVLTMMEDANIGTDLTVQPGQNVIIAGDPGLSEAPNWGSGGFAVKQSGSLSLASVEVQVSSGPGHFVIASDGELTCQIWHLLRTRFFGWLDRNQAQLCCRMCVYLLIERMDRHRFSRLAGRSRVH
jgi:hypothetical protein